MAIKTRRVPKKVKAERTYRGEAEALFLVNELNKRHMAPRDTLCGIIQALQELTEYQPTNQQRPLAEQTLRIRAINKILRQYQARPLLRLLSPRRDSFRIEWQRTDEDDLELLAVLRAIELAQERRIASLKECSNPNCKRWLFARFAHQRFCSEACKEMFHRTDGADKERRRKWARDNYQSRKELELGSRKAVQGNGRKK